MEQFVESDERVNESTYDGFMFTVLPIIIVGILLFCVSI